MERLIIRTQSTYSEKYERFWDRLIPDAVPDATFREKIQASAVEWCSAR
jgi:hypothetical protein